MDHFRMIEQALDYIEQHLTEPLDCAVVARHCYVSSYHLQRTFSLLCGTTLAGYIRSRRLTLAGIELAAHQGKVIDTAFQYGYDSPDSFARAFVRFHGVTPSAARSSGVMLHAFPRLSIIPPEGETTMDYRIEHHPGMILTGFGQRFTGTPYGPEREKQEEHLFLTTHAKQWLLRGAAAGRPHRDTNFYGVITNVDADGYDYRIAFRLPDWERQHMMQPEHTGVDFMHTLGYENITVPAGLYAVFTAGCHRYPVLPYHQLRASLAQWLTHCDYQLEDRPELQVIHPEYAEIWLPVRPCP